MITIVSGTNRLGSNTLKVAKEYQRILTDKGITAGLLSLETLNLLQPDAGIKRVEQEIIIPTDTFIFIVPEYNGSFPGVLKLLFDSSVSHNIWFNKQALITGNATGMIMTDCAGPFVTEINLNVSNAKICARPQRVLTRGIFRYNFFFITARKNYTDEYNKNVYRVFHCSS